MTHTFSFSGRDYVLRKHPALVAKHRAGRLADASLAAAPWYLFSIYAAGKRVPMNLRTSNAREAEARAKDRLRAYHRQSDDFADFLAARAARRGVTLGTLAADWQALGCPQPSGTPRREVQVSRLLPFLQRALQWWSAHRVAAIRPADLQSFAAHKRGAVVREGQTGHRGADYELAVLSALCDWAVAAERIERNPFAGRPRFSAPEEIRSCSQFAPATDEELHRLIGWLFAGPERMDRLHSAVAGAQLLCCALTGLRPGEPGALLRAPAAASNLPGSRYTVTLDGQRVEKMAVFRAKGGQNLAVVVHPALASFLQAWESWLAANLPGATVLFPDPAAPGRPLVPVGESKHASLGRMLTAATTALGLPHRKPHGMRAYYVQVRRGMGLHDLAISVELGQGSGPDLVRRVYGDPRAIVGSGRWDWLPEAPAMPCWETLTGPACNVIRLAAGA